DQQPELLLAGVAKGVHRPEGKGPAQHAPHAMKELAGRPDELHVPGPDQIAVFVDLARVKDAVRADDRYASHATPGRYLKQLGRDVTNHPLDTGVQVVPVGTGAVDVQPDHVARSVRLSW